MTSRLLALLAIAVAGVLGGCTVEADDDSTTVKPAQVTVEEAK